MVNVTTYEGKLIRAHHLGEVKMKIVVINVGANKANPGFRGQFIQMGFSDLFLLKIKKRMLIILLLTTIWD